MANEPSWEDLFKPQPDEQGAPQQPAPVPAQQYPSQPTPTAQYPVSEASVPSQQAGASDDPFGELFGPADPAPTAAPLSRRELRETEGRRRPSSGGGSSGGGRGGDSTGPGYPKPRKKRNLLWLKITLPIVIILGGIGGAAAFAWFNYEDQVRELLGWELPNDYEGTGNGEEVIVTIQSGDIGADVANTLHQAGVTMTFDAVYDILLEDDSIGFLPGNWRLQKEMSAQSAIAALQDPANKVTNQLLITEGAVLPDVLEIIAETTGIPLADVQAAAANPQAYGVPAEAPSLEGYLFPATYQLEGTETAQQILQLLVDTMFEHLDAFGVAPDQRHQVLTMASIIQREAGWNIDDFYKVSRVFQNRLEQGINLESDATVAYGTGNLHTVWTTDAERADASNPYNTYANPGLPIGPIGLPGDDAISAALNPADGPWLFFVPINLATGETVFSETVDEHQAAVDQLLAWCDASAENAAYCE
ncbi:endolytic transglycosylase MltG [Schumannella luteola]